MDVKTLLPIVWRALCRLPLPGNRAAWLLGGVAIGTLVCCWLWANSIGRVLVAIFESLQ